MTVMNDLDRLDSGRRPSPADHSVQPSWCSPTERPFIVKSTFRRWLPAVAMSPTRKAVLAVAGVALTGSALTGAGSALIHGTAAPRPHDAAAAPAGVAPPGQPSPATAAVPVAPIVPPPAAAKAPTAAASKPAAQPVAAPALPKEK